ncbi:MAG: TOBE domain-containing protein [Candidatus Nanopelagicales bacterium]
MDLVAGGRLVAAGRQPLGEVLVASRPSAVVVSSRRPDHASPRNTWPGTVVGVTRLVDRLRLDIAGNPPVVADITTTAASDLGLAPGAAVGLSQSD